jgi:hypothetical protein
MAEVRLQGARVGDADDIIIGFEHEDDARRFLDAMRVAGVLAVARSGEDPSDRVWPPSENRSPSRSSTCACRADCPARRQPARRLNAVRLQAVVLPRNAVQRQNAVALQGAAQQRNAALRQNAVVA